MKIVKIACAGTLESSDVYVEIEPCDRGIQIELESVVKERFGDEIIKVTEAVLKENGVDGALVRLSDKGALECVIRARVETAIMRAGEETK